MLKIANFLTELTGCYGIRCGTRPFGYRDGTGQPSAFALDVTKGHSRHEDGFEGRPKKKAKGGNISNLIDVAN